MDPVEILAHVEALYRTILELTLRQERILAGTNVSELPAVVSEKFTLLDRAHALLAGIPAEADRSAPQFQQGVETLRRILSEVVASEDRCRAATPPPVSAAAPPPRRVMAAYGRR
ncbi:MAG: hypothetical protein HZB55_13590 [Deltaproteobacteria bacterium]|nr:hypothetical protein [Deltaproteobacteria bacterium]